MISPITNFVSRKTRSMMGRGALHGFGRDVELLALPPSLWPVDRGFSAEWAAGRLALAGSSVAVDEITPFQPMNAPPAWYASLMSFSWLRHIPAPADAETSARLQRLVQAWIVSPCRKTPAARALAARRVQSWLVHADVLLQTTDTRHYENVLAALLADVQVVERHWRAHQHWDDRTRALVALAQAGLCISGGEALLLQAEMALEQQLSPRPNAHLYPRPNAHTPTHRSTDALLAMLLDLETLRRVYRHRMLPIPHFLTTGIARLAQTVGGLILGDGTLARLGSARDDADLRLILAAVVRHVSLPSVAALSEMTVGYARVRLDDTTGVVDVGAPLSRASALGLELTSGAAPFIIDDGLGAPGPSDARGTIVFGADAAAPDVGTEKRTMFVTPWLQAAPSVSVALNETGSQCVDATHAGSGRFGFAHRRQLTLDQNGRRVLCVDELRPVVGRAAAASPHFTVRLVLHPSVLATLTAAQDQVAFVLANGHRWHLAALDHAVSVEGCMVQDGWRLIPTLQVLVSAGTSRTVTWQLQRQADSPLR